MLPVSLWPICIPSSEWAGANVAAFTVAGEVGHSSTAMIERVYGHLGQQRHRAKVVEYRVEQHKQAIRALAKARKLSKHVLRLVA